MSTYHIPVLLDEVISGLGVRPGGKYIDATIGGAGHGWEIVRQGGILLGIDTDREALEFADKKFETESKKLKIRKSWKLIQGNFRDIERLGRENGFDNIDGVLFDLGVSSYQLDTARRGFSYRFDEAPLDLRLNQDSGQPASELVNHLTSEELYEIFTKFGEEKRARPIAEAIVRTRKLTPIHYAGELIHVISTIVPKLEQNATLSRIFQSLRIVVNDELQALKEGLAGSDRIMRSGGRIAVISFHSLEDRIVKQYLRNNGWKIITKKPTIPSRNEIAVNIRSRSAKLRIAEKL